ncbi:MAG TPA: cupin domain-containing protein [Verrucomicrobiae bacterium]|nr:cupin domain-containing protein [Verrucomicrobiae bacterium]
MNTTGQDSEEGTLARVLQACKADACVPEKYWVGLIRAIAGGDALAVHALYLRTSHLVFRWALGLTGDRAAAEEATVGVFDEIRYRAWAYDPAGGLVLAWILNCVRARSMHRPASKAVPERPGFEVSFFSLWKGLASRMAAETGREIVVSRDQAPDMQWEEVAPGISCVLLARDADSGQVAMLVRLEPGVAYPPHTHAGIEELYMFEGELTVDDKELAAGDYLRSEPGSSDRRVVSRTGCSGVLITSGGDLLL